MPKKVVMKKPTPISANIKKSIPMKKPVLKTTTPTKKVVTKTIQKKPIYQPSIMEKTLVENFVGLQKIMADLVIKLDGVSNQMMQLLNIFETSAKTLAEKGDTQEGMINKQILEKVDNLIDQNKTLARGVSLLHGNEPQQPRQQMHSQQPQKERPQEGNETSYQKSISSKPQSFTPTKRL